MAYETLLLEKGDGLATVTLNRPDKLNAQNEMMLDEISAVMGELAVDAEVRVIILTGTGRGFCSGGDLTMSIYNTTELAVLDGFMAKVSAMMLAIRNNPKPVIAAVNGVAAGGGCNLALACDMIVASDKAKFTEIFATKSLHPDSGATFFLPRLVGLSKAMELMLTGRMVLADEAEKIGLVNMVVPADELTDKTRELAGQIAKVSPVVARMIKASVYSGAIQDLPTSLENEARAVMTVMTSGVWKESL